MISWYIVFYILYQNQQVYLLENLLKFIEFLMIFDDFKIRDWIKSLSKEMSVNLTKNENNNIYLYLYFEKCV